MQLFFTYALVLMHIKCVQCFSGWKNSSIICAHLVVTFKECSEFDALCAETNLQSVPDSRWRSAYLIEALIELCA